MVSYIPICSHPKDYSAIHPLVCRFSPSLQTTTLLCSSMTILSTLRGVHTLVVFGSKMRAKLGVFQ
jgi:hypothetical protein